MSIRLAIHKSWEKGWLHAHKEMKGGKRQSKKWRLYSLLFPFLYFVVDSGDSVALSGWVGRWHLETNSAISDKQISFTNFLLTILCISYHGVRSRSHSTSSIWYYISLQTGNLQYPICCHLFLRVFIHLSILFSFGWFEWLLLITTFYRFLSLVIKTQNKIKSFSIFFRVGVPDIWISQYTVGGWSWIWDKDILVSGSEDFVRGGIKSLK